jgi:outer membrane protein assembly factor BamB
MVRPERRTRGDLLAAAAIAAVVAVVAALFWWNSSARATISRPATTPAPNPAPARVVPDPRPAVDGGQPGTPSPVVIGGTVVTGDGRTVQGRDAQTGQNRWTFARDTNLCAVSYIYDLAVAVYPDVRGCGQVSGIDAATGRRGPTRTAYADKHVVVSSNGSAILSAGPTRLELWRSDLVRMMSYGEIDARVPVNQGVGTGCTLMSAAGSDSAVSVLEACRDQKDLRLTLLKPAKEEDEPETKNVPLPGVAVDSEARVIAVSGTTTAVYLPAPQPEMVVYDDRHQGVHHPLRAAPTVTGPAVTRAGDLFTWWTGSGGVRRNPGPPLRRGATGPLSPVGPAAIMAGKLLIPVAGGLGVYDASTGTNERLIPLAHPAATVGGAEVTGSIVVEEHGGTLAAFGAK